MYYLAPYVISYRGLSRPRPLNILDKSTPVCVALYNTSLPLDLITQ